MPEHPLRSARRRAGMTQGELATRAGVSRQLVGAVEAGRHLPRVDAALALAQALGTTAEALFGAGVGAAAPVKTLGLAPGTPVQAARVGERLVCVPLPSHGVRDAEWALADGTVTTDRVELLPGARTDGVVVAGCEPALGVLSALAGERGQRMLVRHASTAEALAALARGEVHAAVVHGTAGALRRRRSPVPVRRLHLVTWPVGLASTGRSVPPVEEICERGLPVAQRAPGASSQDALLRAVRRSGAEGVRGPVSESHVDAARRAADGGVVALTIEAAARAFGLGFRALEEHVVELWVGARWAELPEAVALGELLTEERTTRRLALLPGYDVTGCGTLRQAS